MSFQLIGLRTLKNKLSIVLSALAVTAIGVIGALVFFGTANAASGTLYVGTCGKPSFSRVQDAVNAASPGNTVYLCGTFAEQVFVSKSITLTGVKGAGFVSPAAFSSSASNYPAAFARDNLFLPQALLVTYGSGSTVTVNSLNFSGTMPGNGSCQEQEFGILALGGNINLSNDTVANIQDGNSSLNGCQFGVGIQVGRQYWPRADFSSFVTENFAATASVVNTSVLGYQKNGVTVDGLGSSANIHNNTITGSSTTLGSTIAQNGIQISRGASSIVANNSISNNSYTLFSFFNPFSASSGGVLIYGGCGDPISTNVNIHNNTITNNDVGVYSVEYSSNCSSPAATITQNSIQGNTISNSGVTNFIGLCDSIASCGGLVALAGYQAGIDDVTVGDTIKNNIISGDGYASTGLLDPLTNAFEGPGNAYVRPIDSSATFSYIGPNVRSLVLQ